MKWQWRSARDGEPDIENAETYFLDKVMKNPMMMKISCFLRHFLWNTDFFCLALIGVVIFTGGCGAISVGKWRGIERAAPDEAYYLVNDVFLTASSASSARETFDHNMNESVNLYFVPKYEKPTYIAESVWQDPDGQEYRTIRTTYDKAREQKKGDERRQGISTPRMHTISTKELYEHKPGMWKVALYLEKQLVRRLNFLIR